MRDRSSAVASGGRPCVPAVGQDAYTTTALRKTAGTSLGARGGLVGWADRDSQMLSDSGECWFEVGGLWLEDESQRDGAGLALARNSERRALPAGLFYHALGSLGPLFKETKLGLAAACAAKTQVSPPLPTCGTARA